MVEGGTGFVGVAEIEKIGDLSGALGKDPVPLPQESQTSETGWDLEAGPDGSKDRRSADPESGPVHSRGREPGAGMLTQKILWAVVAACGLLTAVALFALQRTVGQGSAPSQQQFGMIAAALILHWMMLAGLAFFLQIQMGRAGSLSEGLRGESAGGEQAREALRESHERLRMFVEHTNDAIFIVDPGRDAILDVNPAACKMLGYSREELLSRTMTDIHPDEIAKLKAFAETVFREGHGRTEELTCLTKNGNHLAAEIAASHFIDFQGRQCMAVLVRDISERKKAEEALRMTQFAVDSAAVPVFWVGEDGRFHYTNQKACEFLGYSPQEMLALTVFDIVPGLTPEGWSADREALKVNKSRTFETRHRRKDGEIVPVEIAVNYLSIDGREYHCAYAFDLTERKQAEEALEERTVYLNALIEHSPMAIVILDAEDRVELCNPAFEQLFGYFRDEVTGKNLDEFVVPPDARKQAVQLAEQVRSGEMIKFRAPRQRKDGTQAEVEIVAFPLWVQWEQAGTYVLYRDITAQVKAARALARKAEELEQSNRELEQFAYVASHDLQEPLRMVASYTQLIARRYSGQLDSDADEFIHYALDGVRRMQNLINDLLAYSRVGTRARALVDTNCQEVFNGVLTNLQIAIEEAGAVVTRDPLPVVKADPTQLSQLLQNLLGNALKFRGPEPPRVHLGSERNGSHWTFRVQDNGIGMEPEYLEKIFVMFQRLHTREEYPGTGIGLAICKKIVERHNGHIWAESEAGKGTTICFTLPVAQ